MLQCPNCKGSVKQYGDTEFIECQECGCFRHDDGEWRPVDMVPSQYRDSPGDDNGSPMVQPQEVPEPEEPKNDKGGVNDEGGEVPAIAEPTEHKPFIDIERFDLGDF